MEMANANYTITHFDFYLLTGDFMKELFRTFTNGDEAMTGLMIATFNGVWNQHEIAGETIGEQKFFLHSVYNTNWKYYKEVLDNYAKEWDYSSGGRKITSFERDGNSESKGVSVDLPNKKISADNIYDYPDSGDKNNANSHSSGTTTVYDTSAFLGLKTEYLDQIRNVFEEFAYRFSDCFLHIF